MRILMVCLGNICRSPLAEGILRSKILTSATSIDSAGTSGLHEGELPDLRSIAVAKLNGIDITDQRSRKFKVDDFDNFDLIYVMDQSNYQNILDIARNSDDESKVKMILNESNPGENLDVPDPYYGGDKGFDNVFRMLDEACTIIASKIQ
ncbi:protein-tyrosine-phosphatase [Tenacibaculum sp. SZ-18]|uniref:low molecular weight protein-tyrosine-phosphatase n=1 Tax=Tenacibaculum sp. SZ-18 TaxID=754423 RepID=UPI000CA11DDB|nr:low molecular weight protein-tyrosine-phosphatase [Tenacibaculum sp. SZ-18]AUC14718.1 protein-tyrosine-phosphatase [Tenacibaculum sp. SZ-18]